MEAVRAGREEQSLLGRRKRRAAPLFSESEESRQKTRSSPELRLLSAASPGPARNRSGMCRTQGRRASGACTGRAGATGGRRRGLEPGRGAVAPQTCCGGGDVDPAAPRDPSFPGTGQAARPAGGWEGACPCACEGAGPTRAAVRETGRRSCGGGLAAGRGAGLAALQNADLRETGSTRCNLPRPPDSCVAQDEGPLTRGKDLELGIWSLEEEAA